MFVLSSTFNHTENLIVGTFIFTLVFHNNKPANPLEIEKDTNELIKDQASFTSASIIFIFKCVYQPHGPSVRHEQDKRAVTKQKKYEQLKNGPATRL